MVPRAVPSTELPTDAAPSLGSYFSLPLVAAGLVPVVAQAALVAATARTLQGPVPLQWGYHGQVTRTGAPAELWLGPALGLFLCALPWLVGWGVARERWSVPLTRTDEYVALQRERRTLVVRLVQWLSLLVGSTLALVFCAVALGISHRDPGLISGAVVASLVLDSLGTVTLLAVYLGRLTETQEALVAIAGTSVLGTSPSGWRAGGLVYYAPDDPAVFVPKRSGLGQTLNFARPSAWVWLGVLVFLPLLIVGLVRAAAG